MKPFIIVSAQAAGFKAIEASEFDEASQTLVAEYDNQADAEAGLARAKALEVSIRPMWLAALAHANKLESLMLELVWEAAKPLANEGEPG